ncbi:MAG: hypothetical protein ACRD3K_15320, partial [Edaphobacter sp.]
PPTRDVAMGDEQPGKEASKPAVPPTLRLPGEAVPDGGPGKVQFPDKAPVKPIPASPSTDPAIRDQGTGPGTNPGIGPGMNPGTGPGMGPGTNPQTNPKPPMQ